MALSLNANWLAAFSQSVVQPVFLVTIDLGGGTTFKCQLGYSSVLTYDRPVAGISPVTSKLDPWTRQGSVGSCEIDFLADGWIRQLSVNHRLKGKSITIQLGTLGMAEADFAPYFAGIIDSVKSRDDGSAEMVCADAFAILRDKKIVGFWYNMHPLEAIKNLLQKADVPSGLYDSTSLDPSQTEYAGISHWMVLKAWSYEAGKDEAVRKPTSAFGLIDELAKMVNGSFIGDEQGKLKFQIFDETTAASASWTDADILEGSFRVREIDGNAINQVTVKHYDDPDLQYTRDESGSQSAYAYPGESARVLNEDLDVNAWLEGVAVITTAPGLVGTTFKVAGGGCAGFCGTRWTTPAFTHLSWGQLSSSRLGYVLCVRPEEHGGGHEIIEVDQLTINSSDTVGAYYPSGFTDPDTGAEITNVTSPVFIEMRIKTRGALGTTALDFSAVNPPSMVYDITIPVAMTLDRLKRWAYGVPLLELKTAASEYAVQVGDFVDLTTNRFFTYGKDGLDSNTKWEVIGKELRLDGEASITWTLAYATDTSAPSKTYSHLWRRAREGLISRINHALRKEANFKGHVTGSGDFTASAGSGLTLNIAPGTYSQGGMMTQRVTGTESITLEASKDSYIYKDMATGGTIVKAVTTGAAAPVALETETPVAKVVAGASSITSVTDQRVLQGVVGTKVEPRTITALQLTPKAPMANNIAPTGRWHLTQD